MEQENKKAGSSLEVDDEALARFRKACSSLAPQGALHSTPVPIIRRAFEEVGLTAGDRVLDVGCGDGRALLLAAEEFGASGVGYEYDEARAEETASVIRSRGLEGRVEIVCRNAMEVIDSALADGITVVFLYLSGRGLRKVLRYLRMNKSSLRVITYVYSFQGLSEEEQATQRKVWCSSGIADNDEVRFPIFIQRLGGLN